MSCSGFFNAASNRTATTGSECFPRSLLAFTTLSFLLLLSKRWGKPVSKGVLQCNYPKSSAVDQKLVFIFAFTVSDCIENIVVGPMPYTMGIGPLWGPYTEYTIILLIHLFSTTAMTIWYGTAFFKNYAIFTYFITYVGTSVRCTMRNALDETEPPFYCTMLLLLNAMPIAVNIKCRYTNCEVADEEMTTGFEKLGAGASASTAEPANNHSAVCLEKQPATSSFEPTRGSGEVTAYVMSLVTIFISYVLWCYTPTLPLTIDAGTWWLITLCRTLITSFGGMVAGAWFMRGLLIHPPVEGCLMYLRMATARLPLALFSITVFTSFVGVLAPEGLGTQYLSTASFFYLGGKAELWYSARDVYQEKS